MSLNRGLERSLGRGDRPPEPGLARREASDGGPVTSQKQSPAPEAPEPTRPLARRGLAGEPGVPPRPAGRVNDPRPALVEARFDGTPLRVDRERVTLVREEWRVVDRWWTEEPVDRRYFDVVLETGRNAVVFRDEERGAWFSQRA